MNTDIERALHFASAAHCAIGQRRKYTGVPYIEHPVAVANIVRHYGGSIRQQIAALLHDVIEDTSVTEEDIARYFGKETQELVSWLTDVSTPEAGNRKRRKEIDRLHTAMAPRQAQFVKCADLLDNTADIMANDKNFARVYLTEKYLLLNAMTKIRGHKIWTDAMNQVVKFKRELKGI